MFAFAIEKEGKTEYVSGYIYRTEQEARDASTAYIKATDDCSEVRPDAIFGRK